MLDEILLSITSTTTNPIVLFVMWLLLLLFTAAAGIVATKILIYFLGKILNRTNINPTAIPFILAVSKIFCYVLVGISVVTSMHLVDTSSIITALGAVGLAVSLAVKDSLSNLMGGVLLIMSGNFSLGDYIELESVSGTVHEISLIHTTLITPDNKRISIPNGQVTNAKIVNYTSEPTRRVDIPLTIGRDCDIEKAKSVLLRAVADHPLTLQQPEPTVRADKHTELGTLLVCKAWTASGDYWTLYYDLTEQLKKRLDEAGIAMPVRAALPAAQD